MRYRRVTHVGDRLRVEWAPELSPSSIGDGTITHTPRPRFQREDLAEVINEGRHALVSVKHGLQLPKHQLVCRHLRVGSTKLEGDKDESPKAVDQHIPVAGRRDPEAGLPRPPGVCADQALDDLVRVDFRQVADRTREVNGSEPVDNAVLVMSLKGVEMFAEQLFGPAHIKLGYMRRTGVEPNPSDAAGPRHGEGDVNVCFCIRGDVCYRFQERGS